MFHHAIVRRPGRSLVDGITSSPQLGRVDYENALRQHDAYIEALLRCGLTVTVLDALEEYPDSCFVEDTAVLCGEMCVLTHPGAPSRKGESAQMESVLRRWFAPEHMERISSPGTLEGGDVMQAENHFFIGLSARTNESGARQLISALEKHGMTGEAAPLQEVLHLKTGLSYLGENRLLICGEFVGRPAFEKYSCIPIPEGEAYAANCVRVNDYVLVPAGYPQTLKRIQRLGYETLCVDTSEFRKVDGGLTCLSLRF